MRHFLIFILVVAGAISLSLALCKWSVPKAADIDRAQLDRENEESPLPIGSSAPDFSVTGLDGKKVSLSDLKGHPVLLDLWATWCGPCVESLPHTEEAWKKGQASGLRVLAISSEDASTVGHFISKNQYTFPVYLDESEAVSRAYKVEGIPTMVVIDANGKLVAYLVGAGNEAAIDAALAKAGVREG